MTMSDTDQQNAPTAAPATPGQPPTPTLARGNREKYLKPSRRSALGDHLAFAVSDEAVQVALCSHLAGKRRLIDVRKVYIPRDLTATEHRSKFVTGVVDDLYHELGGRWKTTSLTVGGTETAFRNLVLPDLSRTAFSQALWFEAKRQLPFPINDCHFDFRRVAIINDDAGRKVRTALIAATKRLIAEQIAPFQSLHIELDAIYHTQDVIGRLLPGMSDYEPDKHYCIINIERMRSEIAYYVGSELEFSHVISLGSSFLANRRDDTVFDYFTETLTNELQNSLDFYSGQFANRFSNQVFIYGDLSYSDELISRLSSRFEFTFQRFPVETLNLFEFDAETIQPSLSVCLPVVATAVNNASLPSLLPAEIRADHRSKRIDRWSLGAVALLAAVIGFIWVTGISSVSRHNAQLASVKAEIEQFRNSSLYATYDSLKQQMIADQNYLAKIKPSPSYLSVMLKELSTLTPDEVQLSDFAVAKEQPDRNGRVVGVVRSSTTPPEIILAEYVERLHRSPVFSQVTVDSYQKRKGTGLFELVFQISFVGRV
jgi:Tfp pilus assembly PilM family ATPase